jgi:hypothetical protein
MGYSVPLARLNEFNFVPEISGDLLEWFGADDYPDYFQTGTSDFSDERHFTLEHGPAWPGDTGEISCGSESRESEVELIHCLIRRADDEFTAYRSSNGIEWFEIGKSTVALPRSV